MAQFLCISLYGPFINLPFNCCAIYFDWKVYYTLLRCKTKTERDPVCGNYSGAQGPPLYKKSCVSARVQQNIAWELHSRSHNDFQTWLFWVYRVIILPTQTMHYCKCKPPKITVHIHTFALFKIPPKWVPFCWFPLVNFSISLHEIGRTSASRKNIKLSVYPVRIDILTITSNDIGFTVFLLVYLGVTVPIQKLYVIHQFIHHNQSIWIRFFSIQFLWLHPSNICYFVHVKTFGVRLQWKGCPLQNYWKHICKIFALKDQ